MKRFEIDEEILKKATKCDKGGSCLSGNGKCLFNADDNPGNGVCYVTCDEKDCPYMVSHGFIGTVCSCPVRVEIYKRYKV